MTTLSLNKVHEKNKKDLFWSILEDNKILVKRCFNYILSKYPNVEGREAAYNHMLIKLWELDVFFKFDIKKVYSKRTGIQESEISDEDITRDSLMSRGINPDKKFEQYIYKWVEQILYSSYFSNGKYFKRFKLNYNEGVSYNKTETHWATKEENKQIEKKKLKVTKRIKKSYPNNKSMDVCNGSKFYTPEEKLVIEDLVNHMRNSFRSKEDRDIFDMLLNGYSSKEIHCLNPDISYQSICNRINSVKSRLKVRYNIK